MTRMIVPRFLSLEPYESFHGYLLRRAESNGYHSLHDITSLVGAPTSSRGIAAVQNHMAKLCELLEIGEEQGRNQLFLRTGEGSRTQSWMFGSKALGNGMVDLGRPKVCPECLDERPFIPAEWLLTFFTVCPRHQRPLVDSCGHCGAAIGWGRSHLALCKACSRSFAADISLSSCHEAQLAQLISGKLHDDPSGRKHGKDIRPLAGISLNGLLEVSLFLGALSSGVKRLDATHVARFSLAKRREVMRAASSAVNLDWPAGFHELVERYLAHQPANCQSAREVLPGFYGPLARRYRREGFDQLISEVGRFLAREHPSAYSRFHGRSAVAMQVRGEFEMEPVSDFCKRIGIRERHLYEFASQLNIELPERDGPRPAYRRLTLDQARRLEELVRQRRHQRAHLPIRHGSSHLSASAFRSGDQFPARAFIAQPGSALPIACVADRLGIRREAAAKIMRHVGALAAAEGEDERSEVMQVDASRYVEWERRISELVCSADSALGEPRLSVGDALRDRLRRYDVDLAWVIGCILDRVVAIAGIDPEREGIDRLLLSESEVVRLALRAKETALGSHIDAVTATETLNLPRDTVIYALRKSGHIRGEQTGAKAGGAILFDRDSIETFRERYITLTELRKCGLGTNAVAIRKRLREAGIEPEFTLAVSGRSTPFYSREHCCATFSIS